MTLPVPDRPLEEAGRAESRFVLAVTAGPHKGRTFECAGHDTFIVGRSIRAHFRVSAKDKYFSRFHFMLEMNPPQCRLLDMNSRNGTFLNGKRVKIADVHDGDEIKAGHTLLRFAVVGGEPHPTPESAPADTSAASSSLIVGIPYEPASSLPPGEKQAVSDARFTVALPTAAAVADPTPCRLCTAPALPPLDPSFSWRLCATCLANIRQQPQTIPGHLLVRKLGQGGMGTVHLALRVADGMVVAVKTIALAVGHSRSDIDRFLREAQVLRHLHHANIVGYHETGEANGHLYFVMEYVAGSDAKRMLNAQGIFALDRALRLCCQVLEALAFAHDQSYVHRDVKPANILIAASHGREMAKLADFGLARVYQASNLSGLTLQGEVGGTVDFIAPEQITNFRDAKPAADQYAVAASLYNLLTGRYIFDLPVEFQDQMLMILEKEPVPIQTRRPDLPIGLADVIHRALAKEPAKRFRDVRALQRELMAFWN